MLKQTKKILFLVFVLSFFSYVGSAWAISCTGSDGTTLRQGTCAASCASGFITLNSGMCPTSGESKCCASASDSIICTAKGSDGNFINGTCKTSCQSGYVALNPLDSNKCPSGKSCCVKSAAGESCRGQKEVGGESTAGICSESCSGGKTALAASNCKTGKCCASASTNTSCTAKNYYGVSVNGTCGTSCQSGYASLSSGDCVSGKNCCVKSNTGNPCSGKTSAGEMATGSCKESCSTGQITLSDSSCTTGKCCFSASSTTCAGTCLGTCPSGYKETAGRKCNDSSKKCCELSSGASSNSNTNSNANSSVNSTGESINFENPLRYNSVEEFITTVFSSDALRNLAVLIGVIMIVVGGIMYMASGGSETIIKRAKSIITAALIGLAIVFGAEAIMNTMGEILGWEGYTSSSSATITSIITNVLTFLLQIAGIIAIISLVIGGSMYMTAFTSEKNAEKAKSIVQNSVIGIIVVLGSLIIINQIEKIIGS